MLLPVNLVIGSQLCMVANGEVGDKVLAELLLLDLEEGVGLRVEAEDRASVGVNLQSRGPHVYPLAWGGYPLLHALLEVQA